MNEQIKKLYSGVVLFQVILFFFFILENIDTLDNIAIEYDWGNGSETYNLNFYGLLAFIAGMLVIALLASIAFNDVGTSTLLRYFGFFTQTLLLSIGSSYYLGYLGYIGNVFVVLIGIVYITYLLTNIASVGGDTSD